MTMCEVLTASIDRKLDMEVVVEAENGRTTLEVNGQFKPDVVLLDINMADLKGQ